MHQISIARPIPYFPITKKRDLAKPRILKLGSLQKVFWILCVVSIFFLLVFYIFQVNAMVSERYSLKEEQKNLNNLLKSGEILTINTASANSLENIESMAKELGFVEVGRINYIKTIDVQVVKE